MLSAVNARLFGFGVMFGGSAGPRDARRRIAELRYVACGATARAVLASDLSIALPNRRDSGAFGVDGEGVPLCTTTGVGAAGAFAGAFFLTESPPEMRREDPSRSVSGINIDGAV